MRSCGSTNAGQCRYEIPVYPLLDHTPPLRRSDCLRIIAAAGLPTPPESACWFCPFRRPSGWAETRRDRPDIFEQACQLEALLNRRRAMLGRHPVWLTRFNGPLAEAISEAPQMLPGFDDLDEASCDNGACFT